VILRIESRRDLCRRAGALVLVTLATVAFGCGSSERPETNAGKAAEDLLKPEELYRYEGTGKEKRKVTISRRERVKLLHEAQKKLESK
jgi:hypothetical protein